MTRIDALPDLRAFNGDLLYPTLSWRPRRQVTRLSRAGRPARDTGPGADRSGDRDPPASH